MAVNNQVVPYTQLADVIAKRSEEEPGAPITLKADAAATTADIIAVLENARAAGVAEVTLATKAVTGR